MALTIGKYYKCVELSQRMHNFTIGESYVCHNLSVLIDDNNCYTYIYASEYKCFEEIHDLGNSEKQYDYIKPSHYKLWNDNNDGLVVLKAVLTPEQYKGFLIGNILKYQLRLGKKPNEPVEKDMAKIKFLQEELDSYLNR